MLDTAGVIISKNLAGRHSQQVFLTLNLYNAFQIKKKIHDLSNLGYVRALSLNNYK